MALPRSLLRLRKKETVMGMMGHTQGVNRARKPPNKPSKRIIHHDKPLSLVPCPLRVASSSMTGVHRS